MGNINYSNQDRGSNKTLKNTGDTGDEKCKIYDLAGNAYEWTTEYSSKVDRSHAYPCVMRGGVYTNDNVSATIHYCTKYRVGQAANIGLNFRSFRSILYL